MKVLVVDGGALVAQSLSIILSVKADVEIVGLGHSGPEAVEKCRELKPNILFVDTQVPGSGGPSAAKWILARDVIVRIVLLAALSDDEYIVRVLRMDSRGYFIRQDVAQITPTLQSVMARVYVLGGEVLEHSVTMRLSARPEPGGSQNKPLRDTAFATLTNHEYEVIEAVAERLDNTEVATRLSMSEGTVRNHISSVLAKPGLRNHTQVMVMYYRSTQAGQRNAHEEADAAIAVGTAKRCRGIIGLRSDLKLRVLKTAFSSKYREDFKGTKKRGPNV